MVYRMQRPFWIRMRKQKSYQYFENFSFHCKNDSPVVSTGCWVIIVLLTNNIVEPNWKEAWKEAITTKSDIRCLHIQLASIFLLHFVLAGKFQCIGSSLLPSSNKIKKLCISKKEDGWIVPTGWHVASYLNKIVQTFKASIKKK